MVAIERRSDPQGLLEIIEEVFPVSGPDNIEPPLTPGQQVQLRERLEKALERLGEPPPTGCAESYTFPYLSESDRAAVLVKSERIASGGISDVADAAMRWGNLKARLRETRHRFDNIRDIQPKLEILKAKLHEISEKIRHQNAQVQGLELKEQGLATRIRELKAAIAQAEKKRSLASPVEKKIDIAHRVRSVVDDFKENLIPLCQQFLEARCSHHFREMIADPYQSFQVKFGADIEPHLEGPEGQIVYVTSLSGAEKRAFGLAFTLAVADVSGQQCPIVIDTPVGNMDSPLSQPCAQARADSAPGQVIFLSHDEEISDEYYQKLKGRVVKSFLVSFEKLDEGSGVSTPDEDRYFGELAA